MHTFSQRVSPDEQERVTEHIQSGPYQLYSVDHARWAAKRPGLNLVLYESGKLVVQGKKLSEWLEFVFEPTIRQSTDVLTSPAGSESQPDAPSFPRIGIDESGKGDFFGPMVVAAFLLTRNETNLLESQGVRDSKKIKSDRKITSISEALLSSVPGQCEVLCLQPETYNRLVRKMGSVNRVLAWGHATVLESLLERFPEVNTAVADQFGPEHQIQSALKSRGRAISLEQRHKAESDPAVAAASILARHRFVTEMQTLSDAAGALLPRGATHVRTPAEDIVRRAGPDILTRLAKTHFRTTRQVLEACGHDPALLGTPEPKDYRRFRK